MDMLANIIALATFAITYLIPFLFVLVVVVFFHELGHFLMARWCGVRIEAFSVGFGGEIFGWTDRLGTRWKFGWIPLGGYVKFFGDDSVASTAVTVERLQQFSAQERAVMFQSQPVLQRSLIAAAGPIANFLLSIVIFAILFTTVGRAVTEARIDEVVAGSPAQTAGFRVGDVVLNVDGRDIASFSDMQRLIATSNGRELDMIIRRDGAERTLRATAQQQDIVDRAGRKQKGWVLGLRTQPNVDGQVIQKSDPVTALWLGTRETWFLIDRTLSYVKDLFSGFASSNDLGGVISIAKVSGEAATVSFAALISLTAVLSVSIGLLNLFPIPMLDGGHLVFYLIEAVQGRPLSDKAQEIGLRIGFTLVMLLMVMATWNDIARLWAS